MVNKDEYYLFHNRPRSMDHRAAFKQIRKKEYCYTRRDLLVYSEKLCRYDTSTRRILEYLKNYKTYQYKNLTQHWVGP